VSSRNRIRTAVGALLAALAVLCARRAGAVDLWSADQGPGRLVLQGGAKWSGLAAYAPEDRELYPQRLSGLGLFRLRLGLQYAASEMLDAEVAYEQSLRWTSHDSGAAGGGMALPAQAEPPYRIRPGYDDILDRDRVTVHHELDRALFALHPTWGEVVVGRQAVGLGRGVLFSAVDMFAPFSPLEVDREWRRGVDAVRTEVRLSPTSSATAFAVFGEDWERSAAFVRLRGYVGTMDAALLAGKRAEDEFAALVVSSAVADAEVHAELAAFRVPDPHPDGGVLSNDRVLAKGVLGASYTFDVGRGLTVLGEVHHSGFGVADTDELSRRFAAPALQERLLRGDMQIIGRWALGLQVSYPVSDVVSVSCSLVENPSDGSGMASPSVEWFATENTTVSVTGFLPWGRGPEDGELRSEYGGSPHSLFAQVALYF